MWSNDTKFVSHHLQHAHYKIVRLRFSFFETRSLFQEINQEQMVESQGLRPRERITVPNQYISTHHFTQRPHKWFS